MVGGGTKKFYAVLVTAGEATIDDLVREIEKFSTLSETDIRAVISALEYVIQNQLADSKIIRLERLGSLYPSLSSGAADTYEEFTKELIKDVHVNYRAGGRIVDLLKITGFKRVGGDPGQATA